MMQGGDGGGEAGVRVWSGAGAQQERWVEQRQASYLDRVLSARCFCWLSACLEKTKETAIHISKNLKTAYVHHNNNVYNNYYYTYTELFMALVYFGLPHLIL